MDFKTIFKDLNLTDDQFKKLENILATFICRFTWKRSEAPFKEKKDKDKYLYFLERQAVKNLAYDIHSKEQYTKKVLEDTNDTYQADVSITVIKTK